MRYQIIQKPNSNEYAPYFKSYIDLVHGNNVIQSLANQMELALSMYGGLDISKINYRYTQKKWSTKEVLLHIIDTERIFTYRALRIARKDKTPLPGFEQDDYINKTNWDKYAFSSLIEEYKLVRKHTILLFNNMSKDMLRQSGISNEMKLTTRAIAFIIAGHETHHLNILKTKYL